MSARIERGKIMLIGVDRNRVLERRFQAMGYKAVCAANRGTALAIARHQPLDSAVIVSQGSLLNVTEKVFNLKDLCPTIKIIVLLEHGAKTSKRFLRQLLDHPIEGSQIMTRRELQRRLCEPYLLGGKQAAH